MQIPRVFVAKSSTVSTKYVAELMKVSQSCCLVALGWMKAIFVERMTMKAWFIDCTPELAELFKSGDAAVPDGVHVNHGDPDAQQILSMSREADVLMVEHTVIPDAVFNFAPNLRAIIFMGTGASTYVDETLAAQHGVSVLTTPGYGSIAVAEHALALMLAGTRRIAQMDRDIRAGVWNPRGGVQLTGRKIAVLGMGGIGQAFAELCAGFGMTVAGWNRSALDHPLFCADLDQALSGADVISLHLTLSATTRGFLDTARLSLPRPGFLLVNTARSQLIDTQALISMLDSGQIGHLATDVFDTEPISPDDPLLTRENVTLTSHAAYMTRDAYLELWRRACAHFEAVDAK